MNRVFVLGSINCDLVIGAPKMPQVGETLSGCGFFINPGGKGANQAVASSKLGAETYLIGAVGCDIFGQVCFQSLEKYGCITEYVKKIEDASTGIASIWVIGTDNRIILDSGANARLNAESVLAVLKNNCKKGDILICQLEIDPAIAEEAMRCARSLGMITLLNPAPVPKDGVSDSLLRYVDIIVPNETEAELLCGFPIGTKADLRKAAQKFSSYGIGKVLITLGKNGAYYWEEGAETDAGIVDAAVVDTTAAGDTTIGALAYRLSLGYSVKDSLEFCAAASALTVSRKGAQQAIPDKAELMKFIEEKNIRI